MCTLYYTFNIYDINVYIQYIKKKRNNCVIKTVARVLNTNVEQTISVYGTNKTRIQVSNLLMLVLFVLYILI